MLEQDSQSEERKELVKKGFAERGLSHRVFLSREDVDALAAKGFSNREITFVFREIKRENLAKQSMEADISRREYQNDKSRTSLLLSLIMEFRER